LGGATRKSAVGGNVRGTNSRMKSFRRKERLGGRVARSFGRGGGAKAVEVWGGDRKFGTHHFPLRGAVNL